MESIAVVTVTRQGIGLGRRILAQAPGARLYLSTKYGTPEGEREEGFEGPLKPLLERIYPQYDGFVFIMAAGIVVRSIAPYLLDKKVDPAVIVMDIAGRFAISLLSGHLGGANELARRVAEWTGATPVITTGTDVNETIAPDLIAKEIGGEIEDFEAMKLVSAALVDGQPVAVVDPEGAAAGAKSLAGPLKPNVRRVDSVEALLKIMPPHPSLPPHPTLSPSGGEGQGAEGVRAVIVITARRIDPGTAARLPVHVVIRPRTLWVGVGCNRGTPAEEFGAALDRLLEREGLSPRSIAGLATAELKRDETGLLEFAAKRGWSVRFFPKEDLAAAPIANPSETVEKFIGVPGVAEPAAILAAGPGARLIVEKVKDGNVTLAVAELAPRRSEAGG